MQSDGSKQSRESFVNIQTLGLESAKLTRINYSDVAILPEVVGLVANDFAHIPWRSPLWTDGAQVRVGAAVWFADIDGRRVAFDPFQAADSVLRADRSVEGAHQTAIAHVLAEAGFERESVDLLVMTHIEDVGMVAWRDEDGSWAPFFPNARVLVSDVVLREFLGAPASVEGDIQFEAWRALVELGVVDTYTDTARIMSGLSADVRGAHCPGHTLLNFGSGDVSEATFIGHLAVSPLHLATGECAALHTDPAAAWSLLRSTAEDGRILIGPLWPTPGFGRWANGAFVPGNRE